MKMSIIKFLRKVKWTPNTYRHIRLVLEENLSCTNCPFEKDCGKTDISCKEYLDKHIKPPRKRGVLFGKDIHN